MSSLGNKKIMAENIRRYMTINNVNQSDICKTLNIKMTTFSDWVNAKTYPRIDKIELLANYFNFFLKSLPGITYFFLKTGKNWIGTM